MFFARDRRLDARQDGLGALPTTITRTLGPPTSREEASAGSTSSDPASATASAPRRSSSDTSTSIIPTASSTTQRSEASPNPTQTSPSTTLIPLDTAAAASATTTSGPSTSCYTSSANSSAGGISYCRTPSTHKHIILGAALGSVLGFIAISITLFLCIRRRRAASKSTSPRHVDVDKVLATLREDVEGKHPQPHQQKAESIVTMSPIERTGRWVTHDQRDSRSSLGLRAMMKKPEPAGERGRHHRTGLSIVKTDPLIDEILLGKKPSKRGPAR
jgi:hypothetical protein